MKLQQISNKKVTKAGSKTKKQQKWNILPAVYTQIGIRLKNTLNNKIQESSISHALLAMYRPWMANYTMVLPEAASIRFACMISVKVVTIDKS